MHGATEIYKLEQSCGADQTKLKLKPKPRIQSIRRLSESTKENKQNKNDTKITHCKHDIPFSVFQRLVTSVLYTDTFFREYTYIAFDFGHHLIVSHRKEYSHQESVWILLKYLIQLKRVIGLVAQQHGGLKHKETHFKFKSLNQKFQKFVNVHICSKLSLIPSLFLDHSEAYRYDAFSMRFKSQGSNTRMLLKTGAVSG